LKIVKELISTEQTYLVALEVMINVSDENLKNNEAKKRQENSDRLLLGIYGTYGSCCRNRIVA
jgi:hypothetical protein